MIRIIEPDDAIKQYCKTHLTYKNPDYEKKKRMGFYAMGTPRELKVYDVFNDEYYLPIGCFNDVWSIHPIASDYKDYSVSRPVKVESDIKLRNYQEPCLKAIEENYTGLFILPAG